MNRQTLIDAIIKRFEQFTPWQKEECTKEALKYMSDANMVVFANEIGIDTDELFTKGA